MLKFLRKKSKLILIIITTLVCVLLSQSVQAKTDTTQYNEALKMTKFRQESHNTNGETDIEDLYTIESVIFNKIPFLDPNIFSTKFESTYKDKEGVEHKYEGYVKGTVHYHIKNELTKWYLTLRDLVCVCIIILGVYNGIRMAISTVADEKAKYKQMLFSWSKAVLLVWSIHFIMIFVLYLNEWIVERMAKEVASTEEASIYYIIKVRAYDMRFSVGMPAMCIYIVLVIFYLKFLWRYIKRYFKLMSLILIAPLVAGRYAFDASKGKNASKEFREWLFDFTKTVMIQTVHVVEYIIFMRMAIELISTKFIGFIYAIVFMIFMLDSEKIVMDIFNFGDTKDRLMGIRSGFRSDWRKITNTLTAGVTFKQLKSFGRDAINSGRRTVGKYKDYREKRNEEERERIGGPTPYDLKKERKLRAKQMALENKLNNSGIGKFSKMSSEDQARLKSLIAGMQRGTMSPESLTIDDRMLLSKVGLEPYNIERRARIKQLTEEGKINHKVRTNAIFAMDNIRNKYRMSKTNIKGLVYTSEYVHRRYQGKQDMLRLKLAALGNDKDAKMAQKALKLHKETRKRAYKARKDTVVHVLSNIGGAGTTMLAAVPLSAVNPLLGAAVVANAYKKLGKSFDPVKDYKYGKKEEKAYNKTYTVMNKKALVSEELASIKSDLSSMSNPGEAIDAMERISKFNIGLLNLEQLVNQYIESNELGEFEETRILAGIDELTSQVINQSSADLSVAEKEQIRMAIEMRMRDICARGTQEGKKIQVEDVAKGVQSAVIDKTVKDEHKGVAEKIVDIKELKNDLKDNYNFGNNGVKDVINDLRKEFNAPGGGGGYGYGGSSGDDSGGKFGYKSSSKKNSKDSSSKKSGDSNKFSGKTKDSKEGKADKSGKSNKTEKDNTKTSKYGEGNSSSAKKPGDTGNTTKPGDTGNTTKPGDTGNATKPGDTGDATKPGDTGNTTKPGDTGNTTKPGDTGDVTKPGDTGDTTRPGDTGDTTRPGDTGKTKKPGDTGDATKPGDTGKPKK